MCTSVPSLLGVLPAPRLAVQGLSLCFFPFSFQGQGEDGVWFGFLAILGKSWLGEGAETGTMTREAWGHLSLCVERRGAVKEQLLECSVLTLSSLICQASFPCWRSPATVAGPALEKVHIPMTG